MSKRIALLVASVVFALSSGSHLASAHESGGCPRVVIFTMPAVTWEDVARVEPPQLMAAVEDGAVGSMSVRTISSRTTYASGFASIGAGARVDGGRSSGYVVGEPQEEGTASVVAAGVEEMRSLLDDAGYTQVIPGALAETLDGRPLAAIGNADLGFEPPVALGRGRWSLLSAMDASGGVGLATIGVDLLSEADAPFGVVTDPASFEAALEAIEVPCMTSIVDPGDTVRADSAAALARKAGREAFDASLLRADALLGMVRARLHDHSDLLIVVAPTSPAWDPNVHFGIAVVVGPGFPPGTLLESPTTRRSGLATLPDIAPTVLNHLGVQRPSSMLGRAMFARSTDRSDRLTELVDIDRESIFIDAARAPVSTVFVVVQVFLFILVALLLWRRERSGTRLAPALQRGFVYGALAVVAFPLATYLAGFFDQLAGGHLGFVARLLAIDVAIVAAVCAVLRTPFDRLLGVTGLTYVVLIADLLTGAELQVNTVFSYSPLVAGRFAGIGNIAYSVLAAVTVITAALLVHRDNGSKRSLAIAAGLFVVAIVVDAAPPFGADVGGILALVPGLSITWLLLAGRRPRLRTMLLIGAGLCVAIGLFLVIDLAQPEESRTHLARLFEDVRSRGAEPLLNVIRRKAETNLRVFRSTIWTYLVPPALALISSLLLRPRNRWQRATQQYPRLRAGLIACLVVAVLGFAVNDSGIVVPAMMLSFLVALALFMHLSLDAET